MDRACERHARGRCQFPGPVTPVTPVPPVTPVDPNNPGGGQLPNTLPAGYAETLVKYDEALVQLVDNAREGEKAAEPKVLLQYTKAAADSITTCAGLARTLYGDVGGKTTKLVNAEKTPYHTAILAAETKISGARNNAILLREVDSEIAKLEGGARRRRWPTPRSFRRAAGLPR